MTRENPLTHHEKLRYDYLFEKYSLFKMRKKRERFAFTS